MNVKCEEIGKSDTPIMARTMDKLHSEPVKRWAFNSLSIHVIFIKSLFIIKC